MNRPKVSVIVCVYGVEAYIERAARSLFEQTLDSIEYIFVDDCTPDASFAVLERVLADYPQRRPQVRILRHEKNQGVAAARTTGMKAMTGEYMIHCDPDAWLEPDAYAAMYTKAKEKGADAVFCGSVWHYPDRQEVHRVNERVDGTGWQALWHGSIFGSLWYALINSDIIKEHEIYAFPGLNNGEDRGVILRMLVFAQKLAKIDKPLYHYDRIREGAMTLTPQYNKKFMTAYVPLMEKMAVWCAEQGIDATFLHKEKYQYKLGLIFDRSRRDLALWQSIWPQTNRWAAHNKNIPLRLRLLYRWGMKSLWPLKLYTRLLDFRQRKD